MGFLDTFITIGIVAAAIFYLYRKFSKSKSGDSCGCSSDGGCCGGSSHEGSSKTCNGSMHSKH
jgi:hypothetical protein